jgi:general secretion pathway protein L
LAEASLAEAGSAAKVAHNASAAQAQLDTLIAAETFLPNRVRGPQPIEVLDALTRRIPDTTWVFRLEIRASEAMLSGFSSDLPALLQQLATPPLATPELASPVVQGLAGGQTRFDLRVQYAAAP